MQHSKDLIPCGTCHFCSEPTSRQKAKFCSLSCNAKYGNKYRTNLTIERYNANPKLCLYCKAPMLLKKGQKVSHMMQNKFCDKSCGAKYHNPPGKTNSYHCKWCGKLSTKWYCNNSCKQKYYKKISTPKPIKPPKPPAIETQTKGEARKRYKSFQSYRSMIQKHARKTLLTNNTSPSCKYCGYSIGIDVCHVRGVSNFSDDTLIKVINDIKNLMALCKRHHHEYDYGILAIESIISASGTRTTDPRRYERRELPLL